MSERKEYLELNFAEDFDYVEAIIEALQDIDTITEYLKSRRIK